MSRNSHVILRQEKNFFGSEPQNLVKNFLIKNLFPKKEKKKKYESSQCASEAPGLGPGARFTKVRTHEISVSFCVRKRPA